ncbi:hypothetical protein GGS26DRAFT_535865 [Hypomontagnella submonticulosa]|nr:hypothetical protein GGS26DRAFT_535865 [Hypomontagnella submonticulosa]
MAACAGPKSHGKDPEECELSIPSPFVETEDGSEIQANVSDELVKIVEDISPGISDNITHDLLDLYLYSPVIVSTLS